MGHFPEAHLNSIPCSYKPCTFPASLPPCLSLSPSSSPLSSLPASLFPSLSLFILLTYLPLSLDGKSSIIQHQTGNGQRSVDTQLGLVE